MRVAEAVAHLRRLPRIAPMQAVLRDEWAMRDLPIRVIEQARQDLEHIDQRDAYIDAAEAVANHAVPYVTDDVHWAERWNRAYFAEMDRLTRR